jgi:hypothetical protein
MKLNATVSQNETSEIYLVTSYLPLVEQDLIPPPGAQELKCEKFTDDRQQTTDNRRRTPSDGNSSPGPLVQVN